MALYWAIGGFLTCTKKDERFRDSTDSAINAVHDMNELFQIMFKNKLPITTYRILVLIYIATKSPYIAKNASQAEILKYNLATNDKKRDTIARQGAHIAILLQDIYLFRYYNCCLYVVLFLFLPFVRC